MKARKVSVQLELTTDVPLKVVKAAVKEALDSWFFDLDTGFEVNGVQLNVVQPVAKAAAGKGAKRGA